MRASTATLGGGQVNVLGVQGAYRKLEPAGGLRGSDRHVDKAQCIGRKVLKCGLAVIAAESRERRGKTMLSTRERSKPSRKCVISVDNDDAVAKLNQIWAASAMADLLKFVVGDKRTVHFVTDR
jgi:hypothetical protein